METKVDWGGLRHTAVPSGVVHHLEQVGPWDLLRPENRIFIARVFDPLLDPKASLDTASLAAHHNKVVRRPFSTLEITSVIKGEIQ